MTNRTKYVTTVIEDEEINLNSNYDIFKLSNTLYLKNSVNYIFNEDLYLSCETKFSDVMFTDDEKKAKENISKVISEFSIYYNELLKENLQDINIKNIIKNDFLKIDLTSILENIKYITEEILLEIFIKLYNQLYLEYFQLVLATDEDELFFAVVFVENSEYLETIFYCLYYIINDDKLFTTSYIVRNMIKKLMNSYSKYKNHFNETRKLNQAKQLLKDFNEFLQFCKNYQEKMIKTVLTLTVNNTPLFIIYYLTCLKKDIKTNEILTYKEFNNLDIINIQNTIYEKNNISFNELKEINRNYSTIRNNILLSSHSTLTYYPYKEIREELPSYVEADNIKTKKSKIYLWYSIIGMEKTIDIFFKEVNKYYYSDGNFTFEEFLEFYLHSNYLIDVRFNYASEEEQITLCKSILYPLSEKFLEKTVTNDTYLTEVYKYTKKTQTLINNMDLYISKLVNSVFNLVEISSESKDNIKVDLEEYIYPSNKYFSEEYSKIIVNNYMFCYYNDFYEIYLEREYYGFNTYITCYNIETEIKKELTLNITTNNASLSDNELPIIIYHGNKNVICDLNISGNGYELIIKNNNFSFNKKSQNINDFLNKEIFIETKTEKRLKLVFSSLKDLNIENLINTDIKVTFSILDLISEDNNEIVGFKSYYKYYYKNINFITFVQYKNTKNNIIYYELYDRNGIKLYTINIEDNEINYQN